MTVAAKRWMTLAALAVTAGVAAQLLRPQLVPDPVQKTPLAVPAEVQQVLEKRCYTCHSDEPKLAWFDQIAPLYWLVVHDVRAARARLNFDTLGAKPAAAQRALLYEAVNQAQLGNMPLAAYRAAHPHSEMTPEELKVLRDWLAPFAPATAPTQTAEVPPDPGTGLHPVPGPSPNGVPYFPDYSKWKLLSTTDRGDNGTLRLITGNDVAIHAVEEGKTNPWPDGAVFAKIALQAVNDGHGNIQAGKFIQVEFMEKDAKKYAATKGWGFARWRGDTLKPYGEGAHFDRECVGCHEPVRDNDYVYTQPIARGGGQ